MIYAQLFSSLNPSLKFSTKEKCEIDILEKDMISNYLKKDKIYKFKEVIR